MEHKEIRRKREKHSDLDDHEKSQSKKRRSRSKSPKDNEDRSYRRKRKNSRSPNERIQPEQRKNEAPEVEKSEAPVRKAKETDMLNTRTGGAYIPPARLRMMQAQITDKSSVAYQRLAWEALKKSIHGHINKINIGNIGIIIKELLKENIVRGRGLLCRSVIQAQAASPTFTNVYAALVAAVNSRFPNIGELLLKRLVIQFKRGFKRNDKPTCISSVSFVAHLVNQKVAHEILALEILTLLVESPTDDSVEVAIAFLKECGQKLTEVSSKGVNAIFEMLRNILHEGQLDKRVQYMIEVMFQVWKDGFKDHPAVIEELELVPEEEQFTHLLMLDDATNAQDILNVFKFDEKYEENEQKYKTLSKEILGSDAESGEGDSSGESGSDESEEEEEEKKDVTIIDNTETNLVALRRTIYLTINSSLDFEECAHKLMKMQLKPGQEIELCHMFLDCCAEQRTYEKFYGLLAQRFCNINRIYIGPFEEIFRDSYGTAHRLDTNRLRNVSKFFAHLLFTDSISWEVLECVKLNEEDTTSSSRIYIKILFQELAEYMGLKKLNDRLRDPTLQEAFSGIFPRDNPKNTRFSINFFTSIGLGGLTDELREHLKQMPKNVPPPVTEINLDSDSSSSDSSSSSSSSDDSSSESSSSEGEEQTEKSKKKSKTRTSKTPENEVAAKDKEKSERWGHDGFYDTYGQGARRLESNRSERDNRDGELNREKRRYEQSGNDDRNNFRRRQEGRNAEDRRNNEEIRDKYRESDRRSNRYDGRETRRNQDDRYQDDTQRVRDKRDDRMRNYNEAKSDRENRDRDEDTNKNKSKRNEENRNPKDRFRDDDDNSKRYRDDRRREMNNGESHIDYQDKRIDKHKEKSLNNKDEIHDKRSDRYKERRLSDEDENRDKRNRRKVNDESDEDEIRDKRERRSRKDVNEEAQIQDKKRERHRDNKDDNREKRNKKHTSDEDKIWDIRSYRNKDQLSSDEEIRHREKRQYERKEKYSSDEDEIIDKRKNKNNTSSKSKRKDKKKHNEQEKDSRRDSASDTENRKRKKDRKEKSTKGDSDLGGRYWDCFDIDPRTPTDKFEERTPELTKKNYDKRRER